MNLKLFFGPTNCFRHIKLGWLQLTRPLLVAEIVNRVKKVNIKLVMVQWDLFDKFET